MSKVLITGCGRSGTFFTAAALSHPNLLGIDAIGHEKRGVKGMASWLHGIESSVSPPIYLNARLHPIFTERAKLSELPKLYGDHLIILHQVRHPLRVINSLRSFTPGSWQYIAANIPQIDGSGSLENAIKYWLLWNQRVQSISSWTYRVEELCDKSKPSVFAEFMERIEHPTLSQLHSIFLSTPQGLNRREFRWQATWSDLDRQFPTLSSEVKALAESYGYDCSREP